MGLLWRRKGNSWHRTFYNLLLWLDLLWWDNKGKQPEHWFSFQIGQTFPSAWTLSFSEQDHLRSPLEGKWMQGPTLLPTHLSSHSGVSGWDTGARLFFVLVFVFLVVSNLYSGALFFRIMEIITVILNRFLSSI